MAINSVGRSGFEGLREGLLKAQAAAGRIAESAGSGDVETLTEALVDLKAAELQAKASVKVMQSENETVGSILDVIA